MQKTDINELIDNIRKSNLSTNDKAKAIEQLKKNKWDEYIMLIIKLIEISGSIYGLFNIK